jgi:hypothetical protein
MSSILQFFGWRPYKTNPSKGDTLLEEESREFTSADLRRMLEIKEKDNKTGGNININLRNFFWEIIIFSILIYISYQIYRSGYFYASITFIFTSIYLLFLFTFNNLELKETEMPWTDCPDYFIRENTEDGGYRCVNTAPESIADGLTEISGFNDNMDKKDRCNIGKDYNGLSWEWCDDPRNM